MPMTDFTALGEAVDAAFTAYRSALEKLMLDTLKKLSQQHPDEQFEYSAGMGVWHFTRRYTAFDAGEAHEAEDDDFEPEPAFTAIQDAESNYGNTVVPDGYWTFKAGKMTRNA